MSNINVAQDAQHEQINVVTIKLKKGDWEVEISCREDHVKQVVESVLSSMEEKHLKHEEKHVERKGHATCKSLLERLWQDGWFANEHNLSDVHEELSRMGYNYDKTAVSHALTDLVREGILSRIGSARVYRYIQKRPPL